MNPEQFVHALQKKGIQLDTEQKEQFATYYETLIEWNQKVNLTSLVEKEDVYLKHFFDSISAAFYYDFSKSRQICDVGAGAGFPSIPLKICFPDLHVTIVDSLGKRIRFLDALATKLGLKRVNFYHDRAEAFAKNKEFRESFDIVMARAVARMPVLSELCLPLCKREGTFIAMKGAKGHDEVKEASAAIQLLGGELKNIHRFSLPEENSERFIIFIDKIGSSPKKYPRKAGTPNKSPLS